eukprot:7036701-Prymnesium_polylepis.1
MHAVMAGTASLTDEQSQRSSPVQLASETPAQFGILLHSASAWLRPSLLAFIREADEHTC